EIFLLAGDVALAETNRKGNLPADAAFSSPDCINVDSLERVWIQSDYDSTSSNMQNFGNCMMTYVNPKTKEAKRFLTGPNGCEITGLTFTPDMKTLFINIQHPGEDKPGSSTWPHGNASLPPRSGTVVIRKDDGGVIGT
ncbi:MAG: alkaline phosphatase PhoX, partial [Casimicrobium sp.]